MTTQVHGLPIGAALLRVVRRGCERWWPGPMAAPPSDRPSRLPDADCGTGSTDTYVEALMRELVLGIDRPRST